VVAVGEGDSTAPRGDFLIVCVWAICCMRSVVCAVSLLAVTL
jgi:hypothetical protein